MMVADTNLIFALVVESDYTAEAESIVSSDEDWITSPLWRYEMQNILAKYIKAKMMTKDESEDVFENADRIVRGRETQADASDVFALVADYGITAYDAQFVALAQGSGGLLHTLDRELLRKFPTLTQTLKK